MDPSFTIQPVNTSAVTGGSAAFSCAVFPDNTDLYTLINITWMFEMVQPNLASGMGILEPSPVLLEEQAGMVTIVNDLPQPGVSVLALYNISELNVGYYYCVANYQLSNGSLSRFESEPAFLALNGELCVHFCIFCL